MKLSQEFELINKYGMHVRPAGALAKLCQKFTSDVTVEKDGRAVSGKSVLGLMTLEAPVGSRLKVTANGNDAQDAIEEIGALVRNRFGILDE